MAEEKCYPVKNSDVTICDHNEEGRCSLFDKKCNNIQEKSKPPKKYTEKEQLERRQEDHAAITGREKESSLSGCLEAIDKMAEDTERKRAEWQKQIGEPQRTIKITEDAVGPVVATFGFWKVPDGVCVYQIDKRGPNPGTEQFFSTTFISLLNKTLYR